MGEIGMVSARRRALVVLAVAALIVFLTPHPSSEHGVGYRFSRSSTVPSWASPAPIRSLALELSFPREPIAAPKTTTRAANTRRLGRRHTPLYALPVARSWLTLANIVAPHHDYAAWDLALPMGTEVFAVKGGVVTRVTSSGNCGRGVLIEDDEGYEYTYCHASDVETAPGRRVRPGELIARSGNTGNSTGPHLHLQIENASGALVCPQTLLMALYQRSAVDLAAASVTGCFYETHRAVPPADLDRPPDGSAGRARRRPGPTADSSDEDTSKEPSDPSDDGEAEDDEPVPDATPLPTPSPSPSEPSPSPPPTSTPSPSAP